MKDKVESRNVTKFKVFCYPLQVTPHLSITRAPHSLVISQKSFLSRDSEIVWFEVAESISCLTEVHSCSGRTRMKREKER